MNNRKSFWVFGNVDSRYKTIRYYEGFAFSGGYRFGDLQDAMKFDSWSDLIQYVSKHWQLQDGIIIREVSEATFDKLWKDLEKNDMTLYKMMHDPCMAY